MDTSSLHDTTVSVVNGDPGGSTEVTSNDNNSQEEVSSNKEVIQKVGRALIRLEMGLACCSEKLVNMNLLMMHVAARESDFEAFASQKEENLTNFAVKAMEFDLLSGVFDSEVRGMDKLIVNLKAQINGVCKVISFYRHVEEVFQTSEVKLRDAEKSLKQSQEQVSELMMQSAKFQRIISSVNQPGTSDESKDFAVVEDDNCFNTTAKSHMQTSEQQRHILTMLEKSLARELDLENQLTECMQALDGMKSKVRSSRQEVLSAEEETAAVYARFLEADNAASVLMGISKELTGQLQSSHLNINSALSRESELNIKLKNCMQAVQKLEKEEATLQELAEKSSSEALVLKERVNSLEEQLKASESVRLNGNASLDGSHELHDIKELEEKILIAEIRVEKAEAECKLLLETNKELHEEFDLFKGSDITPEKIDLLEKQLKEADIQLEHAMASVEASEEKQKLLYSSINDMEIVIDRLKSNVSMAEDRAEKAESECRLLAESNKNYSEELDVLKANNNFSEKVVSLEKQLQETNIQLEQAMASVEASEERQSMFHASINDMKILIQKLKSKVSEANARADSAEDKWIILSESHAELDEELNFLRGKVDSLEESLLQAEETKLAASKDINIRTKLITDLVMQLAVERESLQKQIALLIKVNTSLVRKLKTATKASSIAVNHEGRETKTGVLSSDNHVRSFESGKGNRNVSGTTEEEKSPEDELDGESKSDPEDLNSEPETVRTIDSGLLTLKYVLFASLIVFIAVMATCFLLPENCPF